MRQYLAITSKGLENLLADELSELGIDDPKPVQAGVRFKATQEQIYRCCVWSRIASRFVLVLSEFNCNDDMDLYLSSTSIGWPGIFHSTKRFVVDFNGTNRSIRNSQYGAMKVKDAIVDHFVKKNLPRPSIDKDRADLRIHVRLHKDQAILGVDMVGGSLHIRGYRKETGGAPLRETLAAALIKRSGWTPEVSLLDPMCGSGTLLIEACMMAANIAPGVSRQKWGFQSLIDFNAELWNEVKAEASVIGRRGVKQVATTFYGLDVDSKVIEIAKANARRAGVDSLIQFGVGDAAKLQRPDGFSDGFILSNPPYGERLGTEPSLIALYSAFGGQLKQFFQGCRVALLSSNDELLSCLRMRADKHFKIANGSLQCHFKLYDIAVREQSEPSQNSSIESAKHNGSLIAPDFTNRLKKNFTKLAKWANKEGLDCFRVYDADLPEYNAAIDIYGEFVVVQEYAAPKTISPEKAKRRLTDMLRAIMNTLNVESNNVILKVREKQKGKSQYQQLSKQSEQFVVQEYGASLIVNLQDYLDTGLFLDHKITRRMLGQMSQSKSFLNLFAYTGSASVHAANGGAASTTTVDMSKTYLDWAKQNMALNGHSGSKHQFVQADCLQWLEKANDQYDLIFIDPPTFSNSKRMSATFDVQRDHVQLFTNLERILKPGGTIVFSNNKRHFKMDLTGIEQLGFSAENISSKTLPMDFARNKQIHNCWLVTRKKS